MSTRRHPDRPGSARHRGTARGQTLAEFAIVIPIVLLAMLSLFDLGRAIYAWTSISNAAREAARVAIVDQRQASGVYLAQSEAASSATGLNIAAAAVTVQFRTADLGADCASRDLGCVAVVTVPYAFTPVTPVISNLVGTIQLTSTVRIPIERSYP